MKLVCRSFENISIAIKDSKKKIVMFGAGVIGQITMPAILRQYGLLDYIDCYIDNDTSKWGSVIDIYGKRYSIKSPEYLNEVKDDDIIFLNISRYSDVLAQLEVMECTKNMECYLTPMLCIHNFCLKQSAGEALLSGTPMIPKKINYMWLGKKEMSDNLKRCIETWYKLCPDYEIIQWNENNYDLNKHPYMAEAYEHGEYGFVPDYARIDILYNHGGIYMDTDIELLRNLDPLLNQEAFCGLEKWQVINLGGCSGAVPGHPMMKMFLDARKDICFVDKYGNLNKKTCGFYDTTVILNLGYMMNGKTQNINGMNIYAYDYFHPFDYMSGITNLTENSYSIHRFNGGWMDDKMKMQNKKSQEEYMRLYTKCCSY